MTRYTINIGDEFPLHDEQPGASSRRWGFGLRALFVLSIAAIVFTHPFQAALLFGLALLVRRSNWFADARLRWRQAGAMRRERARACAARWTDQRGSDQRGRDDEQRRDRYKAFV